MEKTCKHDHSHSPKHATCPSKHQSTTDLLCIRDREPTKDQQKLKKSLERKFIIVMIATFIVNTMTVTFSLYSNAISLISDAVHGLFDVLLMFGCFVSVRLSQKKATNEFTYGFHRLETIVSITINIVFLCLLFMCVLQSLIRINIKLFRGAANDEIVLNTKYMIISSSIAIVGDLIIIYLMKTQREIKDFYKQFSRCC